MSDSLRTNDSLAALGRDLGAMDRRIRTLESLAGGVGGWTPELILAGYARVAANVAPPGLRVPVACTLTDVFLRAGTAPTGASLILLVKVNGSTAATLTLAASSTSTSSTGLSVALAAGDIVTFDYTQVGSTVAGADVAVQLVAA